MDRGPDVHALQEPALPSLPRFAGANGQPWEEVLAFDADPRDPYLAKAAELPEDLPPGRCRPRQRPADVRPNRSN